MPNLYLSQIFADVSLSLSDRTVIAFVVLVGCGVLAMLEVLPSSRKLAIFTALDKIWFTARVRSLIRMPVLLAMVTFVVGYRAAAAIFVGCIAVHVAASYVRYCLEYMIKNSPTRPVANLKSQIAYDKVWKRLPQLKSQRLKLLYGCDVLFSAPFVGSWYATQAIELPTVLARVGSYVVLGCSFALLVAACVKTALRRRQFDAADVPGRIQKKVMRDLKKYEPEVIVYFSGNKRDRYQLEQWLKPIDKLKSRVLIVLRENVNARQFPVGKWPVVVARTANEVEAVTVPSIKVALYVSNAAKNLHLLRNGNIKHIHLNHGDSDKASSANPICRAYDALFVAGEAGVRRYREIGFDGKKPEIVKVGRPQLHDLKKKKSKRANAVCTVLYAPTWEGLTDAVNYSSVASLGPELVRQASRSKDVKLIVKLHPNTGRFLPEMAAAQQEMIELANSAKNVEIVKPKADLFACFKKSDVIISDVSAVVSDYLALDQPIVMTRPTFVEAKKFKKQFPLSGGAITVDNQNATGALSAAKSAVIMDPSAKQRRAKQRHVLGYHPNGPQETFDAAVRRFVKGEKSDPVEPLNILLTLHKLDVGGAERDCIELSSALLSRGHKVSMFAQDGSLRGMLDPNVTFIERPQNRVAAAVQMAKLANRFDVINTHDLFSLLALAGRSRTASLLATVHNVSARRYDRPARLVLKKVPDKVVFVSESERSRLFQCSSDVGTVVRPGIGSPRGLRKLRSTKNVKPNVVLYCGRLSYERGPDHLIRALRFAPELRLQLVGSGTMENELAQLADECGVASRVDFLGTVLQPFEHISAAAVVAVPSRRDALPRIVREAAALGKQIVGSDVDGIKESAGEYKNIRYCNPNQPKALAKALMEAAASKISAADYLPLSNWDPMVESIESLHSGNNRQRPRHNNKRNQANTGVTAKEINKSKNKAKNRQLDGVNKVVRQQKRPMSKPDSPVGRQNQSGDPQNSEEAGRQNPILSQQIKQAAERAKSDVVVAQEVNGSPDDAERNARFNHQMTPEVQFLPERRSQIPPTSELTVNTIRHQIQLAYDDAEPGGYDVTKTDQSGGRKPGDTHYEGDDMLMGRNVFELPRKKRRDLSPVDSPSPVLAGSGAGHRPTPELGEGDVGVPDLIHDYNPITNETAEVDTDERTSEH